MKKVFLGIIVLTAVISFYGCSTIKGLGEDVSTIGGWIVNGSEHVEESVKKNPPGSGMNQ